METTFQFLEKVYLPGYMTISSEHYDGKRGVFDAQPKEPLVTILSSHYLTPGGSHIIISQAGICLVEHLAGQGELDLDLESFRNLTCEGRLKLIELNQKFRRELPVDSYLQARFTLTKFKQGRIPVVQMDFDLGDRAFIGDLTCVIAPKPIPQMNADILRDRN